MCFDQIWSTALCWQHKQQASPGSTHTSIHCLQLLGNNKLHKPVIWGRRNTEICCIKQLKLFYFCQIILRSCKSPSLIVKRYFRICFYGFFTAVFPQDLNIKGKNLTVPLLSKNLKFQSHHTALINVPSTIQDVQLKPSHSPANTELSWLYFTWPTLEMTHTKVIWRSFAIEGIWQLPAWHTERARPWTPLCS